MHRAGHVGQAASLRGSGAVDAGGQGTSEGGERTRTFLPCSARFAWLCVSTLRPWSYERERRMSRRKQLRSGLVRSAAAARRLPLVLPRRAFAPARPRSALAHSLRSTYGRFRRALVRPWRLVLIAPRRPLPSARPLSPQAWRPGSPCLQHCSPWQSQCPWRSCRACSVLSGCREQSSNVSPRHQLSRLASTSGLAELCVDERARTLSLTLSHLQSSHCHSRASRPSSPSPAWRCRRASCSRSTAQTSSACGSIGAPRSSSSRPATRRELTEELTLQPRLVLVERHHPLVPRPSRPPHLPRPRVVPSHTLARPRRRSRPPYSLCRFGHHLLVGRR